MRVAVASDNGQDVSPHFGRCDRFVIFDVEGDKVSRVEERVNQQGRDRAHQPEEHGHEHHHDHGQMLELLKDCQTIISGGMGIPMRETFLRAGRQVILTGKDDAAEAVRQLAEGKLQ